MQLGHADMKLCIPLEVPDTHRTGLSNICSRWSLLANSEGGFLSVHPLKRCRSGAAKSGASAHWTDLMTAHGAEFAGALGLIPNEGFTRVVLVREHK